MRLDPSGPGREAQEPTEVQVRRRVSARGAIMIGGQKIQVGLPHARKTVDVIVETDSYRITVEDGITITAPRTISREILRRKASNYDRHDPPAPPGIFAER